MPSPSGPSSTAGGHTRPALKAMFSRHARKAIFISLASLSLVLFLSLRVDASFKEAAEAYESANVKKMFKLLESLAKKEDARAQSLLGTIYYSDVFVKEDIDRAHSLFEKAAEQGDAEAQYNLGIMYELGEGSKTDYKRAAYWLEKAAVQGHPAAQLELGTLHIQGAGVPKSKSKARKWLDMAARQDLKLAKSVLDQLDLHFDQPPEYSRIVLMAIIGRLEIMKEHGLVPAQVMLGSFYARGIGVPHNRITGLKWLTLASFQTPETAEEARQKVASEMTPLEVKEAEKQAIDWLVAASKKTDSYIGQTSQWCHNNHPESLDCLKRANIHHEYCMAPYFPGYFKDFTKSKAYHLCRESRFKVLSDE